MIVLHLFHFVALFLILSLFYFVWEDRKSKKRNKIFDEKQSIINKILSEASNGDEFANLIDIKAMMSFANLSYKPIFEVEPKFVFLGERYRWNKTLTYEGNINEFWNKYQLAKKRYFDDNRYKVHAMMMRNFEAWEFCMPLYPNGSFGILLNKGTDGKLKHAGFEKLRYVWKNVGEDENHCTFRICDEEIDEFYSLCELIMGEDLIW